MKKQLELIPPENYTQQLKIRAFQLENAIKMLETSLKNAPQGTIRIAAKGKSLQFYHLTEKGDKKGKYLSKKDLSLAQKIIQAHNDKLQLAAFQEEYTAIKKLLSLPENSKSFRQLSSQNQYRKDLITPATISAKDYAKEWLSVPYKAKSFTEDSPVFTTSNGLRVRSKSEIIIAETLLSAGIPFRYEYPVPVQINDSIVDFHPDFYCLNLRTRKEFVWEHFGMMDTPEYADNAVSKMNSYARNNYFPGFNLIITEETKNQPLSTRLVQKTIETYLL